MTNKITKVFSKKVSLEMIEEREKKIKKEKAKVRKSQQRPREERGESERDESQGRRQY
jgi:hypothetical protein